MRKVANQLSSEQLYKYRGWELWDGENTIYEVFALKDGNSISLEFYSSKRKVMARAKYLKKLFPNLYFIVNAVDKEYDKDYVKRVKKMTKGAITLDVPKSDAEMARALLWY